MELTPETLRDLATMIENYQALGFDVTAKLVGEILIQIKAAVVSPGIGAP